MKSEICSQKSKMEVDEKCSIAEKDHIFGEAVELPKLVNVSVVPVAPTPERNNEEAAVLNCDSPLTWVTTDSASVDEADEEALDLDSSPRTPKEDVFDSFAPGPDDLMLAPQAKKFAKESKVGVVRRLNFDSPVDVKENPKNGEIILQEEEVLLDKMYKSLLDAIVTKQTEEGDGNMSGNEDNGSGLKTPSKMPLLEWIAESCPAAPKKPRSKSKRLEESALCRRIEF